MSEEAPPPKKSPRLDVESHGGRPRSGSKSIKTGSIHARAFNRLNQDDEGDDEGDVGEEELKPLLGGEWQKTLPSSTAVVVKLITGSYLNWLLLFVVPSFLSNYLEWSQSCTFALSFLSLVPLAALLGELTEEIARHSSETTGAILNATFGNATEMIISVFALIGGMPTVIQNSLIGSVLGNMLLVLGCAIVAGSYNKKTVTFNANAVQVYTCLLLLACFGLIIPTTFRYCLTWDSPKMASQYTHELSHIIALLMCAVYVLYLIFQLKTHSTLFDDEDGEEGDEESDLTLTQAVCGMAIVTVLIAFESEFLVGTLEETAKRTGLSKHFISVILLPIVGNAAEHATAIFMAHRGKMDIALGVAIGSSIQIAMFVIPFLVVVAWMVGSPLDLNFHPFSTVVLLLSVMVCNALVLDGKTHWLEGVMLLVGYVFVALAFLFTPNDTKT